MKSRIITSILIIAIAASCSSKPKSIPEGTWNYDLLVNGIKAGKAVFSNTSSGDNFISRSEMHLNVGAVENKSVQIITETKDFRPVKLEVYNTVNDTSSKNSDVINKIATFNGGDVTLKTDEDEARYKIKQRFILDGNYFFNELLKKNFKTGTVIRAEIYEPSVEIDAPILVVVEVKGMEEVQIGKRTMKLLHIKQRVEKLKSMDLYINEKGVTEKVVIKMLNNVFELVRVE
jgi:hypothetical protein